MAKLSKYDQIIAAFPEMADLSNQDKDAIFKCRDDSDGIGDYIVYWNYDKPLPGGLMVGKPE